MMVSKTKLDMRGSLWRNTKKEKPGQPDYTGNCKVDGVDYYLSGWLDGGGESKRISISFTKMDINDEDLF
jgi:hypothetical protein